MAIKTVVREGETLDDAMRRFKRSVNKSGVLLETRKHEAYLKKGLMSEYWKWRREFKRKFRILPDQSLNYLEYKVIDKDHNEIDLKEEKDTSSSETSKKERRSKHRAAAADDGQQ